MQSEVGGNMSTQADLEESIEVVIAGYQKKNAVLSDKEKLIVSYHEIGHALVAALQTHSAPVTKITIIPRTSGALGYTMQVEEQEQYLLSKEELENKIATFTRWTCGRGSDISIPLQQVLRMILSRRQSWRARMITRYGMSEKFGMVALETVTNQYMGGDTITGMCAERQQRTLMKWLSSS